MNDVPRMVVVNTGHVQEGRMRRRRGMGEYERSTAVTYSKTHTDLRNKNGHLKTCGPRSSVSVLGFPRMNGELRKRLFDCAAYPTFGIPHNLQCRCSLCFCGLPGTVDHTSLGGDDIGKWSYSTVIFKYPINLVLMRSCMALPVCINRTAIPLKVSRKVSTLVPWLGYLSVYIRTIFLDNQIEQQLNKASLHIRLWPPLLCRNESSPLCCRVEITSTVDASRSTSDQPFYS